MTPSPLVCPRSVGREQPLARLVSVLNVTQSSHGAVLLVGGPAGVGKSTLIRDLKQEAASRGFRTVEGRCSSVESSVPYAPFMDALRFRIAQGEGEAVARMLGPLRQILAPIFPELPQSGPPADAPPDRPFGLIFGVLEKLAGDDPMLLVLEDIHWADPTSLELLQRIAHRAGALRLMIVATFRSDELHSVHPLRRTLAAFTRERCGEIINLEPLTREATREMLECMLGTDPHHAFVSAIWSRAEGNPFFTEEILNALAAKGPIVPSVDAAREIERSQIPDTVSEAVMSRVQALGAQALDILSVAAVMGRTIEFEPLHEVLDIPEESLVSVIEQLVAHQLLKEERVAGREHYTFPHALMQEALYQSIIARRRRILHRQIANVLEKRSERRTPEDLDRLAYHFRLGGEHEKAYQYSLVAGDEAVRLRAWDDAKTYYECALEALEGLKDDGTRSSPLLEKLGDVAWRQGNPAAARQYLEEALRLRRVHNDSEAVARLLRRLAAIRVQEGENAGAAEVLDEALQILSRTPDNPELRAVFDDLGRLSLLHGDLGSAESLLLRGLGGRSTGAHGPEEVRALVGLAEIEVVRGQMAVAEGIFDVAFAVLQDDNLTLDRAVEVYYGAVRSLIMAQSYHRALRWAEAAIALCTDQGMTSLAALFKSLRAAILTTIASSENTLHGAIEAAAELRLAQRPELREALRVLGFVHRIRGDFTHAKKSYQEAAELGDRFTGLGLALVALAEGRSLEAADSLLQIIEAVPESHVTVALHVLPHAVEALVCAGRSAEAVQIIERIAGTSDSISHRAELRFSRGLIDLENAQEDYGSAHFAAAADEWERLDNKVLMARAMAAQLEAMFARGNAGDGEALGRKLMIDLDVARFPKERERVRRILRRAGIRTRSDAPASAAPAATKTLLTERETAVLQEVAKGRTNREIAGALGIAEKTVSVHVSHILAKLGCRTRTEAARFAHL